MATRQFFRKAHSQDKPPKVPKVSAPKPPVAVLVSYQDPETGQHRPKLMNGAAYRKLMGNSKGGQTASQRGTAHRWTSDTARKAIQKFWRTKGRKNKRIGVRLGLAPKRRPMVLRAPLRLRYSMNPDRTTGIWYNPVDKTWTQAGTVLSERQALRKLGHLASSHRRIPGRIVTRIDIVNGSTVATPVPQQET